MIGARSGWMGMLALVAVLLMNFAGTALAQGAGTPSPAAPAASPAPTTGPGDTGGCKKYPGLTNRIASCIRATLDSATKSYFKGFYKLVSQAITAFITLGLIIYGVMAALGSIEQVGRDTIYLLMKIAFIGYLTTNTDYMYSQVLAAMDGAAESAVKYTPGAGVVSAAAKTDFSQVTCLKNLRDASTANGAPPSGPWLAMDCLLDTVIGIKVSDAGAAGGSLAGTKKWYNDNLSSKNGGLSRGLLYLFFSGMQTSVAGAVFAAIGFIFIYGLVFLIVKTLFVYLASYIGIAFLMIISPLFIPLVLIPRTKDYFDKWVKLVISFSLQPIIMLVFVSMTITAVDLAAFSADYSLMYRIAGDESRKPGFSLNDYLLENRNESGAAVKKDDPSCKDADGKDKCGGAILKKPATLFEVKANADPLDKGTCTDGSSIINGICKSKCVRAIIDPKSSTFDDKIAKLCAQSYPVKAWRNAIDWEKLAKIRQPAVTMAAGTKSVGEQLANEVLSAAIFCGIVVFVMNGLLKIVPVVAYDLLGDFGQSPNLASAVGGVGRNSIKKASSDIASKIGGAFKGGGK